MHVEHYVEVFYLGLHRGGGGLCGVISLCRTCKESCAKGLPIIGCLEVSFHYVEHVEVTDIGLHGGVLSFHYVEHVEVTDIGLHGSVLFCHFIM